MRLHSVTDVITNSSSELFVVQDGRTAEALIEVARWFGSCREALPEDDPWRGIDLSDWAYLDTYPLVWEDGSEQDVITVPYGLPAGFSPRRAPLVHSVYLDG